MKLKQKFTTNQDRKRLAAYLASKKSASISEEFCQQIKQSSSIKNDNMAFSSNSARIEARKKEKRQLNDKKRIQHKRKIDSSNKNNQDEILKNDVKRFLDCFKKGTNDQIEDEENDEYNEQQLMDFSNSERISKRCSIVNDPFERRSIELAEKAHQTLSTSMFRYLNEYLYTHSSYQSYKHFNLKKFQQYHEAYERIMNLWPLKPIDFIIDYLKKRIKPNNLPKTFIADVGCGKYAKIAQSLPEANVFSFDLHSSTNSSIISADMTRLPLDSDYCHYCIYSLSLMPTNLQDVFCEANRILKLSSYMIIVEVASRFADYKKNIVANNNESLVDTISKKKKCKIQEKNDGENDQNPTINGLKYFANNLSNYGFRLISYQLLPPNDYFLFILFKKFSNIEMQKSLPTLTLKPCVYKVRSTISTTAKE